MALAHLAAIRQSDTIGIYALAFLDSAVALFTRANRGHGRVDFAFYPAAYCLRHGVELLVKQLSEFVAYELRSPELLYRRGHALAPAWERIRKQVEELVEAETQHGDENGLGHDLDVVTGVIEDLHELDENGMLFRYPEDVGFTNGVRTREETPVLFDDVNLDDWQATAEATLGAAEALRASLGGRADLIRQHRSDPPKAFSDLLVPPKP